MIRNKQIQIALAMPNALPHIMRITRGIVAYARGHGRRWSYLTSPEAPGFSVLQLKGWSDGAVICCAQTRAEADCAAGLSVPVVNVSGAMATSPVARISVDNHRIGVLAAEHFLARNFRRFAFYGLKRAAYSARREAGFAERLEAAGFAVQAHRVYASFGLHGRQWATEQEKLSRWLAGLATPVALLAVSDYRAALVLACCGRLGLDVPSQVAVIGVNNDETTCENSLPPLSSVARNDRAVGYRAAELLDRMLRGRQVRRREVLLPPEPVVVRRSTQTFAVDDPRLEAAVRFIGENFHRPITVETVLGEVLVSRRWLEAAFRKELRCSPYQFLQRRRLARARDLLTGGEKLSIERIARRCGISSAKQLHAIMLRNLGVGPTEYRRRHTGGGQGR